MLAVLAADWGGLLFRGSIALLFGIAALVWPDVAFGVPFVLYALIDGMAALIVAFHLAGLPGFRSFLFDGIVRVTAGFVVLAISGLPVPALVAVIAAWAGLSGIGLLAAAAALRREMTGEWPLPLAGALSLVTAAILLASRGGGLRMLAWTAGFYSILVGLALIVLAVRLRHLALEMAAS